MTISNPIIRIVDDFGGGRKEEISDTDFSGKTNLIADCERAD